MQLPSSATTPPSSGAGIKSSGATSEQVVVVDDEEDILELVRYNLTKHGYQVFCATTGEQGLELVEKLVPHLLILDLMLPGVSGIKVCETIRGDRTLKNLPIVILSARGEEEDVVAGLETGADDYITKPFSPSLLLARCRAVVRRRTVISPGEQELIRYREIVINPGKHEVTIAGEKVSLTFTEFKILHLLSRRPGWVFTRYQIVDGVRGEDYAVTERAVDVQIVGLRKKLGGVKLVGPLGPADYIETVRGVGYRLLDEDYT